MKTNKGKYDKLLTVFLILIFIAFLSVLGPIAFNYVKSEYEVKKALDNFEETTYSKEQNSNIVDNMDPDGVQKALDDVLNELNPDGNIDGDNSKKNTNNTQVNNYGTVGKIEIPKTNVNYPIYGAISRSTLEAGVAVAYGPGINQVGNTVIYGHNFRNGKFFSNNKKLTKGDIIYITDLDGNRVTYRIYNMYVTTSTDASYMIRDTGGRTEISLQTCTDDSANRLIIWATAN